MVTPLTPAQIKTMIREGTYPNSPARDPAIQEQLIAIIRLGERYGFESAIERTTKYLENTAADFRECITRLNTKIPSEKAHAKLLGEKALILEGQARNIKSDIRLDKL